MKQNLFVLILICGSVLVCFATSFCIHTNIFHTSLPSLSHDLFDHYTAGLLCSCYIVSSFYSFSCAHKDECMNEKGKGKLLHSKLLHSKLLHNKHKASIFKYCFLLYCAIDQWCCATTSFVQLLV